MHFLSFEAEVLLNTSNSPPPARFLKVAARFASVFFCFIDAPFGLNFQFSEPPEVRVDARRAPPTFYAVPRGAASLEYQYMAFTSSSIFVTQQ